MMFMRFPIDAVFVGRPTADDAAGRGRSLSVHRGLRAWTGLVPFVRGAHGVLELPVGTIEASGTAVGDLDPARPSTVAERERPVERPALILAAMIDLAPARRPAASMRPCRRVCVGCGREGAAVVRRVRCRPSTRGSRRPPASRSGCPRTSRLRSCSSTGARRSAGRSAPRCTRSSTAASNGSPSRSGAAVARRWARIGVGGGRRRARAGPRRAAPRRGATTRRSSSPAVAARELGLPYVAPLVTRERATIAQFDLDRRDRARQRRRRIRGGRGPRARARDPRAVGPARRRRRHDRRHPGRVRRRALERAGALGDLGHHRGPRAMIRRVRAILEPRRSARR